MPRVLRHHRAHDYNFLIRRWRSLSARSGLLMQKYGEAGGYSLFFLRSRVIKPGAPSIYFSAGIHGDEPATTEGLLAWAEANPDSLHGANVLIFPCLNAWGLACNCRLDAEGRDLNRSFHSMAVPQIAWQIALFSHHEFDLALTLHEDYDALGLYIYEVKTITPYWAEKLIAAAAKHIACDPRRKIEGRSARNGVIRRTITPDLMPEWPEAFVLHFQNVTRVFTTETPSEFHLDDRVAAQVAIVETAVALCREEFSLKARRGGT